MGKHQDYVIELLSANPAGLTEAFLKHKLNEHNGRKIDGTKVLNSLDKTIVFENGVYKLGNIPAPAKKSSGKKVSKNHSSKDEDNDYSKIEFKKRITINTCGAPLVNVNSENLFEFSYNFLRGMVVDYWNNLSNHAYTEQEATAIIENYLNTPNAINGLDSVFKELCSSLQTSGMLNNVIGFYRRDRNDKIRRALFDFDVHSVADLDSYKNVFEALNSELSGLDINFGDSWEKYAKGVYSGAKFITRFSNYDELIERIKHFENYEGNNKHLSFPAYQAICGNGTYKITLMGEVIALNWLKEIGLNYGKPDTHILDVFVECGLLEGGNRQDLVNQCESILENKAEEYGLNKRYNNFGVYALDKVIWLCCSGHFYRHLNMKFNDNAYRIPDGVYIDNSGWKKLKQKYLIEMQKAIKNGTLQV